MRNRLALLLVLPLLAGCGSLVPDSASQRSASAPARSQSVAISPQGQQCLVQLGATGSRFEALPDKYYGAGCSALNAVSLQSLAGDHSALELSNIGPLTCPTAEALSGWARFGVDRAARQILGSPLRRIETMGSYACRNVAGSSRLSAHARAEAVDVAAFVLEDGRRISVLDAWSDGSAPEREFLRIVQESACKRFGTVLGPEYNAAHRDHFHLERSPSRFCR